MNKPILSFLAGIILWSMGCVGWADLIFLESGGRLEGIVLQETEDTVQVEIEGMGVITIPSRDVIRIVRQEIVRPPTSTPVPVIRTPSPRPTAPYHDMLRYSGLRDRVPSPSPTAETPVRVPEDRSARPAPVQMAPTFTPTPVEAPVVDSAPQPFREIERDMPSRDAEPEDQPPWTIPEDEADWESEDYGEGPLEMILGYLDAVSGTFGVIWRIVVIFLCVKIGEKKGNSPLFCIVAGVFFGIFGLIMCSFEPPVSLYCFIACCVMQALAVIILVVLFLTVGFAALSSMGGM